MALKDLSVVKEAVERKRKSLFNSIMDGMAYSVMVGFGESLIIPFALALNASNLEIGLLATLPVFLGALVQLLGANLLSALKNRLKIILPFVLAQALMWLLIAVMPLSSKGSAVLVLIVLYCFYVMFGQLIGPVWNSLMGDIVPIKQRGIFFGKRNALTGLTALSATLISGFFLFLYPAELLLVGFASMFLIAMAYRFVSFVFLRRMYEPAYIWVEEKEAGFFHFLKKARTTNFGLFVLFVGFMNFSVFVASPFFTPYMLNTLGFNYLAFVIVNSAATAATIITMKRWGVNSDIFGNKKVLALTGFLVCFVPLLWVFSPHPLYLIAIQLFSGFAWAGFNLSAANFVYDMVEPSKIARYLAYQNIVVGTMAVAGGLAGSFIVENVSQPFFGSNYLFVFLTSAILRFVIVVALISRIGEVRKVSPITERQLFFKMVTIRPIHGIISEALVIRKKISKIKNGYRG